MDSISYEKDPNYHKWIPGLRYMLTLKIDDGETIFLGRFRRQEGISKVFDHLYRLRGYKPGIMDTKNSAVLNRFGKWETGAHNDNIQGSD